MAKTPSLTPSEKSNEKTLIALQASPTHFLLTLYLAAG